MYYVICTAVIILSAADKQMLQRKGHRVIKSEKIIIWLIISTENKIVDHNIIICYFIVIFRSIKAAVNQSVLIIVIIMASGALFPSMVSGSRGSSSKYLVEFRAGKMTMKGSTVTPDKRKGQVYIQQTDDSLIHFCWKDRTTGNVDDVGNAIRMRLTGVLIS